MGDEIRVAVSDSQHALHVSHADLEGWVRAWLSREGILRAELSIALVDNARIRELNRLHLQHDWPTDIITFDLSDEDGDLEGELVISAEMAVECADRAGSDPTAELALYVAHGLLHLLGEDDHDPEALARMQSRERDWLIAAGFPPAPDRHSGSPAPAARPLLSPEEKRGNHHDDDGGRGA
jgi:probable rRNA maturation factor